MTTRPARGSPGVLRQFGGTTPAVRIHTGDSDEARQVGSDVYFPHRLTVLHDPAEFTMSLYAVELGPVSVGLLGYGGEVRVETGELETAYQVNVPLNGYLCTRAGTAEVCASPDTAAVYRPDDRTMLQGWAGGGQVFGLKITRAALEAAFTDICGVPARSGVNLAAQFSLTAGPGRQWWALARALTAAVEDPDGPLSRPIVARPLVQSIITALLYSVDHPHRDVLARPPERSRPKSIDQAIDIMEAEPAVPFTVRDIAYRVGVSTRTLQESFARHVGVSPMGYLRETRLRRAHEQLAAADPAAQTVADIANCWGFAHLGRFAAAYRARYGTSPSHTLRSGS